MLAGLSTGSVPMFLLRMWLQKPRIKFQVLKANMVALACRMVTRTTQGLLRGMQAPRLQRAVVVRQSQMRGRPRLVDRNVQAGIGTWKRAVSALHQEFKLFDGWP
jgi:hypothetical protein